MSIATIDDLHATTACVLRLAAAMVYSKRVPLGYRLGGEGGEHVRWVQCLPAWDERHRGLEGVTMRFHEPVVRPTQLLFASWIAFFGMLILDGYVLNLLGLPADAGVIFVMLVVEGGLVALAMRRRRPAMSGDPLELAGFLLVVVGTWLYFVYSSWPTLLPPTYAGDAPVASSTALSIFYTGRIVGDLPGGPPLIVATIAHWIGWSPVRLIHPLGALWIALTAGAVYGLACTLLPDKREFKTLALLAPAALYVPWGYFIGSLVFALYFWTQTAGQLFLVAFVWFLVSYHESRRFGWALGMALCLVAISLCHQMVLPLPLALFAWVMLRDAWKNPAHRRSIPWIAAAVVGPLFALWLVILSTARYFVPDLVRLKLEGPLLSPSLEALGGWLLVLPALGLILAVRKPRAEIVVAFLVLGVLQTLTLGLATRVTSIGTYWMRKSVFPLILPLALLAVVPVDYLMESITRAMGRRLVASVGLFVVSIVVLMTGVFTMRPPLFISPLSETDIQVALWAREHLDTRHIQYVGTKSLTAFWIAMGMWGESLPGDLGDGLLALGPKTFEEWRNDPDWGEYLFISNNQRHPLDPATRLVYQRGDSAIVQKPVTPAPAASAESLGHFGRIFSLIDYALSTPTVFPGQVISVTTHLATRDIPGNRVAWRLQLRDLANDSLAEQLVAPFGSKFPGQRWPDATQLTQALTLTVPADISPGVYDLQLGLYQTNSGEPERFSGPNSPEDDVLHLARVKVPLPPVPADQIATVTRVQASVGDAVELFGFMAPRTALHAGDVFNVDLYWRCAVPVARDYTVYVHLTDAGGKLYAQQDVQPRQGTFPTSIWQAGDIVVDSHALVIPKEAAPGHYALEVGMYAWPDVTPLPVAGQDGRGAGDRIVLPVVVQVIP